jgi:hypothetical protein
MLVIGGAMNNSEEKLVCVLFAINCAALWKYLFFVPKALFSYHYMVTLSGLSEIICTIAFIVTILGFGAKIKYFNYLAITVCAFGISVHSVILSNHVFCPSIIIILGLCFCNTIILLLFKGKYLKNNLSTSYIFTNTFLICHFLWFIGIATSNSTIFFGDPILILYTFFVLTMIVYYFMDYNGIFLANYVNNHCKTLHIGILGIILTILAQNINPEMQAYFWFSSIIPISMALRYVKRLYTEGRGNSIIHL